MSGTAPTPIRRRQAKDAVATQDVAAYCARPACGREFRRSVQPGRPQIYCQEDCRRAAEQEIRKIKSRLRDLEATVAQQRRLLTAYGSDDDMPEDAAPLIAVATPAVARAAGALRFLVSSDERVAEEFKLLYDAVEPLFR